MSEQLLYDPRTKQQIKDILYRLLYDPVQRNFKTQLDGIITKNAVLGRMSHASFSYKGELYNCDTSSAPPRKANRLLPQMVPIMETYLAELRDLNEKEVPYVLGYINQVLNSTNTLTDYLRLLPDAVHDSLKSIITTCPCCTKKLPAEVVTKHLEKNQNPIAMMKQRMAINLII